MAGIIRNIYFFKDRDLALRLKAGDMPEKEKFVYFLLFMTFTTLGTTFYYASVVYGPIIFNFYTAANDFLMVGLTVLGTIFVYSVNQKGDGKHFIERYICLGLPVLVRTVVIIVFPLLVVFFGCDLFETCRNALYTPEFTNYLNSEADKYPTSNIDVLFQLIIFIYFYWRLSAAIQISSGQKQ